MKYNSIPKVLSYPMSFDIFSYNEKKKYARRLLNFSSYYKLISRYFYSRIPIVVTGENKN